MKNVVTENRADLLEVFKLIKGFTAVSWTHFFIRIDNGTYRPTMSYGKKHRLIAVVIYGFSSLNEQSIVATV